jgi:hypothetical protein
MSDNSTLVRRFVDTYNRGDTEAIVALVTLDVELGTPGGLERGPGAARLLAGKSTQEHVLVHIEVERMVEAGEAGDKEALRLARLEPTVSRLTELGPAARR